MKLPEALRSPLAATVGVVVGMLLLAIPLRHLTSKATHATIPSTHAATHGTPAWLTLKLLAPAESVNLTTPDGKTVWSLTDVAAGETEIRKELPIEQNTLDLTLTIHFKPNTTETAAFLTIAPDQRDAITQYAFGKDVIHEPLTFNWIIR
jgi:hypothetical protein